MTISTFCREQLLADGPLTLDELADRASRAGVTRASNPRATVKSAMCNRELELSGERWVTPLWLLEGRCLTTPFLGDTSDQDLGLLRLATNLAPIPLVGGGYLARHRSHDGWKYSVPLPQSRPDELLCFRITGGALEVTTVPTAATLTPAAGEFVKDLNRDFHVPMRGLWSASWEDETNVLRRLAELLMADDELLRSPLPPLSECSEILAEEVRRIEQRREQGYNTERYHPEPYYPEPWTYGWADTPDGMLELSFRLTAAQAEAVETLASKAGRTVDEWFRDLLDDEEPARGPAAVLRLLS